MAQSNSKALIFILALLIIFAPWVSISTCQLLWQWKIALMPAQLKSNKR